MSLVISSRPPNYIGGGKGSLKDYSAYPMLNTSKLTKSDINQYSLSMTAGYITTPPGAVYNRVFGSWTFECWIKWTQYVTSGSRYNAIITNRGASSGGSMLFLAGDVLTPNKKICFDADDNAGTQELTSTQTINLGQWYHLAFTFDFRGGSSNVITLYINGQLEATSSSCPSLTIPNDAGSIGTWFNAENGIGAPFGLAFNGNITEIRLWNTVRTLDQIQTYKNQQLTGMEPGLIHYFPINEGSGGIVKDIKGGVTGTLINTSFSPDHPFRNNDVLKVYSTSLQETKDYYNALIANGGSISAPSLFSVNELVKDLKLYGLWDKIDDMGVFAGDNLQAVLTKLKMTQGVRYLVNHGFTLADYNERGSSGGLVGASASSKYLDTGHNVSGLDGSNISASIYSPLYSGVGVEFGEDQTNRFTLFPGSGNLALFTAGVYATGRTIAGGLFGGSRLPGTNLSASMNGDFSTWSTADGPASLFNETCFLFARNENGIPTNPSNTRLSFYHIGKGLTSGEWGNLYAAVQRFQRQFGRQFGS